MSSYGNLRPFFTAARKNVFGSGDPGFIDFKFSGKTMHACHAPAQIWLNRAIILKYGIIKKYSQNISKQFNAKTDM